MRTIHLRRTAAECVAVAALVAALLTTATAVAGTSEPAPSSSKSTIGEMAGFSPGAEFLQLPPQTRAADLDAVVASGAKWFRVSLQWSQVEKVRGAPEWSNVDLTLKMVLDRGLRPIVMIGYTPEWARPATCYSQFCPPANHGDFARFVKTAVGRYAPFGVKTYEIWNEPNIENYWRPAPDAKAYASLLRTAASAARSADPSVTILSAGLAPAANDRRTKITPATFVKQMYDAGAASSFDGLGMHPYAYPVSPLLPRSWNAFYTLPVIYKIMVDNGDGAKKIWMTEFGYPTGLSNVSVSPEQQAAYLVEAYRTASSAPWAGPLLWFNLRDRGDNPWDPEHNFGTMSAAGTPKPAHDAFTQLMRAAR